jgi:hypothetical protein
MAGPSPPWDSKRPRDGHPAAAPDQHQRLAALRAHGQARDLRVGAQEEEQRGLRRVASRDLLGVTRPRAAREDPRHQGRPGQELEVGSRPGEDALERACARLGGQPEQAPASSAAARREAAMLHSPAALTAATVRTAIVLNRRARRGSTAGIYRAGGASVRCGGGRRRHGTLQGLSQAADPPTASIRTLCHDHGRLGRRFTIRRSLLPDTRARDRLSNGGGGTPGRSRRPALRHPQRVALVGAPRLDFWPSRRRIADPVSCTGQPIPGGARACRSSAAASSVPFVSTM